ncbi:hypothetical protein ACLOJK_039391 [Asimina triloba]
MAPAFFVFGDSLVDVGNNNYLPLSADRANFPFNGIDFPGGTPTGRFSNGKNAADFLAEMMGLATPPPYLSIATVNGCTASVAAGVNFASGGAGILDDTSPSAQSISLDKQIDYFSEVQGDLIKKIGTVETQKRLSKSIFLFVIGENDVVDHFTKNSTQRSKQTPQQFMDQLFDTLKGQLKRTYDAGGRKVVFAGAGSIGCCPVLRSRNETGGCLEEINYWCVKYNEGVKSLLEGMKCEREDFSYSFFDTFTGLLHLIQHPDSYGFTEAEAACCGMGGKLNARDGCIPTSSYCSDRDSYVFWDFVHPTEKAYRIMSGKLFDGSQLYTYPINMRHIMNSQKLVPAIYVFGDSLADVGNNNYLGVSLVKANFPHNGIDFPGGKATGRFSNGKNAADFFARGKCMRSNTDNLIQNSGCCWTWTMKSNQGNWSKDRYKYNPLDGFESWLYKASSHTIMFDPTSWEHACNKNIPESCLLSLDGCYDSMTEKLGLNSPPPYLSLLKAQNGSNAFVGGVNFASGGAGVLDGTDEDLRQSLTLNKQVEYYSAVYASLVQQMGAVETQKHLSKSIFAVVIGSNDLLGYFKDGAKERSKYTPQQFLDLVLSTLRGQLKRVKNLGARKMIFAGTGAIGCCPSQRNQNKTGACNEETNYWSVKYNEGAKGILEGMKAEQDFSYSFFNTYIALQDLIEKPAANGFTEVKAACCGLGNLNAKVACIPISHYCSNRENHVFWDFYHPTEAASRKMTDKAFDGSQPYTYPINIKQLAAL